MLLPVMHPQKSGGEVVAVEDVNWKEDAKGLPGRQLGLQLLLRVVADVGIVGFPNAGGRQNIPYTAILRLLFVDSLKAQSCEGRTACLPLRLLT